MSASAVKAGLCWIDGVTLENSWKKKHDGNALLHYKVALQLLYDTVDNKAAYQVSY